MDWLSTFQRPVRVGVEVGARTLKVAWVVSRRGGATEWQFVQRPRTQQAGSEALRQDLAKLLQPLRRRRFIAALTLGAPTSHVRSLAVQVADPKQLPSRLRDELPKLLPFDVTLAQYKFLVRHRQRVDGQWNFRIALAACEAAPLSHDLEALWQAGWGVSRVVPCAVALLQTAKALEVIGPEPVIVMAISERRTTIVLVEAGEAVYARDVALGDEHLTDALMAKVSIGETALSLSREDAEVLKREVGIPESPTGQTVGARGLPMMTYLAMLQPILEQLVSEVRRTMTFGAHAAGVTLPERIIISGEGAGLPGADQWLSKQLGVPVARLSCERLLGTTNPAAAIACGLALCNRSQMLDLQPAAARQRWTITRSAALFWRGLIVVAVFIWLTAGVWTFRHRAVARQLRALGVRWSSLQPVVSLQQALEAQTRLVHSLVEEQGIPTAWFRRLARGFPNPLRLTKLSLGAQQGVSMEGQAQEREQIAAAYVSELTLWLKQAKVCEQPQLGSSRPVGDGGGVLEFSLTCHLVRE